MSSCFLFHVLILNELQSDNGVTFTIVDDPRRGLNTISARCHGVFAVCSHVPLCRIASAFVASPTNTWYPALCAPALYEKRTHQIANRQQQKRQQQQQLLQTIPGVHRPALDPGPWTSRLALWNCLEGLHTSTFWTMDHTLSIANAYYNVYSIII